MSVPDSSEPILDRRDPTAMLRAMLDSVAEGVVGVDREGRFTMWNAGATRLLGLGATETGIPQWSETYHLYEPDSNVLYPSEQLPLARALLGESVNNVAINVGPPAGDSSPADRRQISVNARPVVGKGGEVIGAVAVFRDVTDLRAAEHRARQREAELNHVTRLSTLGELASGLAHELNQPLAAISGFVQGCQRRRARDTLDLADLDEVFGRIADQADRAGQIIKRMRALAQKRGPVRVRVSLNAVLESVASLLQAEAADRDTRLDLGPAENLPPVQGDPIELEQVALNLIRNAIEAMVDVPTAQRIVRVATGSDGVTVTLEVTDAGPGLDPAVADRVFEPFFTTKPDGLGMGLKICQTIIEVHGGRLTCHNEPTGGCTFRVELPVRAAYKSRFDPLSKSGDNA